MKTIDSPIPLADLGPRSDDLLAEVLDGLSRARKTLPCKLLYDDAGSALFDRICEQDEYYPTRTETAILRAHAAEMIDLLGERCLLIEYGSGSGVKSRILLDQGQDLAGYVPVDISRGHLIAAARDLQRRYPNLEVLPVCADYTRPFEPPLSRTRPRRAVVFFPGSTIGNFHPNDARAFLGIIAETCGPGAGLLIGVDLKKDTDVLEHAYNDRAGVTAAFNLNLLTRLNLEMGGDFLLSQFQHYAFHNTERGRVEMHLVSLTRQSARLGGRAIDFEFGETIRTEVSYKYETAEFSALAFDAGWRTRRTWTDPDNLFSVHYLTAG